MRFTFILTARFPTEKAYGVTTQGSMDALRILGHDVAVVTATSNFKALKLNKTTKIMEKRFRHLFNESKFKVQFKLKQFILFLKIFKLSKKQDLGVIWTREVLPAFLIRVFMPRSVVVLELHQVVRNLNLYLLNKISDSTNLILSPIKKYIAHESGIQDCRFVVLPMGVSEEYLVCGREKSISKRVSDPYHVVYLGREINAHEKLDLNYLITNLQNLLKHHHNIQVWLVGLREQSINQLLTDKERANFHIFENLSRGEILNILRFTDFGLVIYPDTLYYRSTFPIKIVEYAATKTLIVASDTPSHRELLGQDKSLFFTLNDKFALSKTLKEAIIQQKWISEEVFNAFEWSETLSYVDRVTRIIDELKGRGLWGG